MSWDENRLRRQRINKPNGIEMGRNFSSFSSLLLPSNLEKPDCDRGWKKAALSSSPVATSKPLAGTKCPRRDSTLISRRPEQVPFMANLR